MNSFKLTGLAAGSAATDSVRMSQLQNGSGITLGTIAGTNTITAVGSPVITAYAANQTFIFTPANTNTGATTINIDGLGAKNIYLRNAACSGGELVQSVPAEIVYDGTQFQIVSTGALVTTTTTQTLTNKTLTSPTMTTPTLGVASATSINFGQTALSYYGEGTWTPTLGGSATYTAQAGRYTRVGRFVFASFRLDVNAIGTGSTSTISGLPFATGDDLSGGSVPYFTALARSVTFLTCSSSSSTVVFSDLTAAATGVNFTTAIFASGAGVRGSVHYQV